MKPALQGPGLLISASKDPDAKMTFIAAGSDWLAVKVPSTRTGERAVEAEGRVLVGLRRLGLGPVAATVPRYVASPTISGHRALVSSALPGRPMSVDYHHWRHTARRRPVRRDLRLAAGWLEAFQAATTRGTQSVTWPTEVADMLRGRWDGHPRLGPATALLSAAVERLAPRTTVATAVHGDYWFGNVLLSGSRVSGVVDWESGALLGSPLRDLARFPLSYALYLDRHAPLGGPVPGHPGLHRSGFGAGVRYVLLGSGWMPDAARGFLGDGLQRLGLPRQLWYDVAVVGLAEVAATANDDAFGSGHLRLLASLPDHPRGRRRPR